jgi:hypothetical protein
LPAVVVVTACGAAPEAAAGPATRFQRLPHAAQTHRYSFRSPCRGEKTHAVRRVQAAPPRCGIRPRARRERETHVIQVVSAGCYFGLCLGLRGRPARVGDLGQCSTFPMIDYAAEAMRH